MSLPERLVSMLRGLPGVTEEVLWGNDLVYKVGGKMFAVFGLTPDPSSERPDAGGSFKVRDEDFEDLASRPGLKPAPYLARAKWIAFDGWRVLPIAELEARLRTSYELVRGGLPRRRQSALGGAAPAAARRGGAKKPAAKKPAEKKPAEKKPAEKKPAEKKPAAKKPAAKEPAAKKTAAKKTAAKKPAAKKPAAKKPAAKKPAAKKPAARRG